MQNSTTFRTVSRQSVQFAVLATVAAVGVSVGRWVVPEASGNVASSAPNAVLGAQQAPVSQDPALHTALPNGGSLMERKLAQMDREDDARAMVNAPVVTSASTMERKLAQMDAEDDAWAMVNAPVVTSASTMERKLAQMDAEDARLGVR